MNKETSAGEEDIQSPSPIFRKGRIAKLKNMIKLLYSPGPMEELLPHASELVFASGSFTPNYPFADYDTFLASDHAD